MHNNFYFLRQLSNQLSSLLTGAVASECFSQSKDELVIRFETKTNPFYIKASLSPDLSCLSFPENFQRARKNSVDLFPGIIGRRVTGIRQFKNERSFSILFSDDHALVFKMHGNRTNVVLIIGGTVAELFRNKIRADLNLSLDGLDREINWSHDHFRAHAGELKSVYFTFGKVVWEYLEEQNFANKSLTEKWELLQLLLKRLENPLFYITMLRDKPTLSLVEVGQVIKIVPHSIEAANEYYHTFTHDYAFAKEKNALLNTLRSKLSAGNTYCEKNSARLAVLQRDSHYRIWADLIMANIHAIPAGAEKITVQNFYAENRPVEIRLKKDLTPQKNAENYYRKAKNQHIEVERLESAIHQKTSELEDLSEKINAVDVAQDLKTLRALKTSLGTEGVRQDQVSAPYHEFQFKGYRIWVGKNAQSNDVLTLKSSYKEDLWLHAKDVSGSHVLIKHQAGKKFPKDVIEYAASLAAFNSKRKNESLCPVIVTPKKYVRKRKGDPPGAVVVEREDVIMVEPARL